MSPNPLPVYTSSFWASGPNDMVFYILRYIVIAYFNFIFLNLAPPRFLRGLSIGFGSILASLVCPGAEILAYLSMISYLSFSPYEPSGLVPRSSILAVSAVLFASIRTILI